MNNNNNNNSDKFDIEQLRDEFIGGFDDKFNSLITLDTLTIDSDTSNVSTATAPATTTAQKSSNTGDYVNRVLDFIASLFNNKQYSDLEIVYDGGEQRLAAHKFVLKLRNADWKVFHLDAVDRVELNNLSPDVVLTLFRWVYSGEIELADKSDSFILEIIEQASLFQLDELVERCESTLNMRVNFDNCVHFYQKASQLSLTTLAATASSLITRHWDSLELTNFAAVSNDFLHILFKEKSAYPLHKAIRIINHDLVERILRDYDNSWLEAKVNEPDNLGETPLDIALGLRLFDIAHSLIEHKAAINRRNANRESLLHQHIAGRNFEAAKFLIEHGASLQPAPHQDGLLHLCADIVVEDKDGEESAVLQVAKLLIDKHLDINYENGKRETALHRSILTRNVSIFDLLLSQPHLNLNYRTNSGESPIYLALKQLNANSYFAKALLEAKASIDEEDEKGNNLLLKVIKEDRNEAAAMFLVEHGFNINSVNVLGETPLHLASLFGLDTLVVKLLTQNANCNLATFKQSTDNEQAEEVEDDDPEDHFKAYQQTPLHYAVLGGFQSTVRLMLSFHESSTRKGLLSLAIMKPDLNVQNSAQQTPLSLAIERNHMEISEMLINSGADINIRYRNGLTLLHRAIQNGSEELANFSLDHGADFRLLDRAGESYLQYAVRANLPNLTQKLCEYGLDSNVLSAATGDPLLWEALTAKHLEVANELVRYGCNLDRWHLNGENGFYQTMLHRALDENKIEVALFLIYNRCNINCTRRPGGNKEGAEYCFETPLHIACSWSLVSVAEALLEHGAEPNLSDNEGKSALHLAILNQDIEMIKVLLTHPAVDLYKTDNFGNSPFSLAVKLRNKEIAKMLCELDEHVAEQCDGKGRNFLHMALKKVDYESVLFLLDLKVNVNTPVQDSERKRPLHLAAETGSEIILRTLNLAGANVNEESALNQTALHLAAELDNAAIVNILLDFNTNAMLKDINGNNAFHLAAYRGNVATCEAFLERDFSFEFYCNQNYRGYTALHCLAVGGANNPTTSDIIFDMIIRKFPRFPLNTCDTESNTPLLLAFMKGNAKLCRAFVREGAQLGARNVHKASIFNHKMPTRQLLSSLLESLARPPEWREGPECLECGASFGLTNRRHHCRHCGRELCGKCSSREIIIMKYITDTKKSPAPSRVCDICHEVLSIGVFD